MEYQSRKIRLTVDPLLYLRTTCGADVAGKDSSVPWEKGQCWHDGVGDVIMTLRTAMNPGSQHPAHPGPGPGPGRAAYNPRRLAQGQVNLCIQRHWRSWVVVAPSPSYGRDMEAEGTGAAGRAGPFLMLGEPGSEKRACRPGQPSPRTLRGWDSKTCRGQGSSRVAERRCVCAVLGVEMSC